MCEQYIGKYLDFRETALILLRFLITAMKGWYRSFLFHTFLTFSLFTIFSLSFPFLYYLVFLLFLLQSERLWLRQIENSVSKLLQFSAEAGANLRKEEQNV